MLDKGYHRRPWWLLNDRHWHIKQPAYKFLFLHSYFSQLATPLNFVSPHHPNISASPDIISPSPPGPDMVTGLRYCLRL
jgi:hypothetical protein